MTTSGFMKHPISVSIKPAAAQFCLDAHGGVRLGVVDHSTDPDEANKRNHDDGDPDQDQHQAVIVTERAREAIELQSRPGVRPAGFGNRSDEEVEFLDDKAKRDDRDARPDPGEKSPLVCGVV
nr:hypothetical protein [Bradyrhizobium sp. 192]